MGEFKAQILAVLLVLGIFGLLNTQYDKLFKDVWNKVETKISQSI